MMEVNKDLVKERKSATFDADKVTEILYGGKEAVRRRNYFHNLVIQDKYLQSFRTPWCNRTREEDYDCCIKKSVYVHDLITKLRVKNQEAFYITEAALPQEGNTLALHFAAFLNTIDKQGTREQIAKYGEPARRIEIIGTYAQTELGHGTFIRGLETTATYDPSTEEFIINSPTLTSMKYWPGIAGKTANFVVLMAQLYTRGRCHGVHAFVVQIRSREDHTPMPGVTVGDIGNKMGFSSTDNGFLIFNNYRVPRDAMLMRYAKVEKDGTYVPPQNAKITYGSMVSLRALIVTDCARDLAKACVIAVRYSAVRRQTEVRSGGEEPQILDYQTQQEKVLPVLAAAYAFLFAGSEISRTFARISADIDKGRIDEIQVLHALAAGMKALSAQMASSGIDRLRMACGGHGYSQASGLPKIFANTTPACTYEGENTVMFLQCARYLIKCYAQAARGQKLPGFMSYLNNPVKARSLMGLDCDVTHLLDAYEHTAARLIGAAALKIQSLVKAGQPVEEARNQTSVQLHRAAIAHSELYVVRSFIDVIRRPGLDLNVRRVFESLCQLYAVSGIITHLGDFIQDGYISGQQADMLLEKQLALFREIRPNAVALVDAFDYPDQVLDSCLGRYDGNVYEALYEYAKNSPLNKSDVLDSYHTTLRPLMKGTQSRL